MRIISAVPRLSVRTIRTYAVTYPLVVSMEEVLCPMPASHTYSFYCTYMRLHYIRGCTSHASHPYNRTSIPYILTYFIPTGTIHYTCSALAAECDETVELVQRNIYAPFLRSVKKHTCGVAVNVLAYADQPICFWREM